MSKCRVHWFTDENGNQKWKCPKFLLYKKYSYAESEMKCFDARCRERLPVCKTEGCYKTIGENKLRHCSEKCRKRDNRNAYKKRQKEKEND